MAPGAVQRAAFEKDRGADARTVFGAELLEVKGYAIGLAQACSDRISISDLVRLTGDDFVLDFLAQAGEVGVIASDAYQQVAILVGMLLRLA